MTLFTVGPTEIEREILELGACPQVYMRTKAFSDRLEKIYENLQYVFQTDNPVLMFASSGTGALDAATGNFVAEGDKVVVINGGSFGQRWKELCERAKADVVEVRVEFGKSVSPLEVAAVLRRNPAAKALFATLDETSSGALTDIRALGEELKAYPETLFIVDCVSGLVAEPFETDKWGVDVAVTASQKALALPAGLSFMAVSRKALKKAEKVETRPYYFDVLAYEKDWHRHQTPFTPAVSLICQLERRLEKIRAEGLDNLQNRYFALTGYLREKMEALGFRLIAEQPANCVSGYWSEDYDALRIVEKLQEAGIEIAPSGGNLSHKMFRIGTFGNISASDIDSLAEKMKIILSGQKKQEA